MQSRSPRATIATGSLTQEAGQVRKMQGTCVTPSIFRSRDFGTWRCPVDAAICHSNTSHSCLWRLLAKRTSCVGRFPLRQKPLVEATRCLRSLGRAYGKLPQNGPSVTSCVKMQSRSPRATIATGSLTQEAGQVRKMPGTCVTPSVFRSRDFGTWRCPVAAICHSNTFHSCLWRLLGNWTACVDRLSHRRLQLLVESTRVRDRKPPQDEPSVTSCVKMQSRSPRATIATGSLTQEAGQVRKIPGTCVTPSIFRSRDIGTWPCSVDAAICMAQSGALILHREAVLARPRPLVEKRMDGSGCEQLAQTSLQHRRQGPSVDSSTWFPLQTRMRSQTMNDGPAVVRKGSLSPLQSSVRPGNYVCFLGGALSLTMRKTMNWPRLERLFSQSIAWQLQTMDHLWAGSISRPGPVHLYVLSRLLGKVSPTRVILSGMSLGNVAATACVQVTELAIRHSIRALVLWDHIILPGFSLKPVRLVNSSAGTTAVGTPVSPEFSAPPCRLQAPSFLVRCSFYERETVDAVNDYVYAIQSFGAVTFEGLRQACLQDTSHSSTYRDDLWDITRVLNFAAG
ncbi:unnamed protein product [Symbiodinium sp. CCMP2592]|nr:unnamed protein product [Symbiodinium sp. CCMP2592]